MRNIRGLLLLDFIVNWHVSIQILLEVSLRLKLLEFLVKICLKMKDVRRIQFSGQTGTVIVNLLNSTK